MLPTAKKDRFDFYDNTVILDNSRGEWIGVCFNFILPCINGTCQILKGVIKYEQGCILKWMRESFLPVIFILGTLR